MNSVLRTVQARHGGHKLAAVLKEVQVPPAFLYGIVSPAKLATLWTRKLTTPSKVQTNLQSGRFSVKIASHYPPWSSFEL